MKRVLHVPKNQVAGRMRPAGQHLHHVELVVFTRFLYHTKSGP